jgi:hypothetical protein
MDKKRKICDIRTWKKKKHLFLDISSTNINTLVPSLYQCVETRSIEVFWLLSQPLPHFRFTLFVIRETFATKMEPLYASNTPQHKQQQFFMNIYYIESFCPQETYNKTMLFGSTFKHVRHFDY